MIGMSEVSFKHSVKKEWASKSVLEKNERVDALISLILKAEMPYDELEMAKEEAAIIANMLLRK